MWEWKLQIYDTPRVPNNFPSSSIYSTDFLSKRREWDIGSVWIELIFVEIENQKYCNKIIFKYINNIVELSFNIFKYINSACIMSSKFYH